MPCLGRVCSRYGIRFSAASLEVLHFNDGDGDISLDASVPAPVVDSGMPARANNPNIFQLCPRDSRTHSISAALACRAIRFSTWACGAASPAATETCAPRRSVALALPCTRPTCPFSDKTNKTCSGCQVQSFGVWAVSEFAPAGVALRVESRNGTPRPLGPERPCTSEIPEDLGI